MRAVIIGNGTMKDLCFYKSMIKPDDIIICADGGFDHAHAMGLEPDLLLGDMDSVHMDTKQVKTVTYPAKKDATDGEIAVEYALSHGFDEILMMGFIGDRMDHTLTNLFFLKLIADSGKKGVLVNEMNEIYCIKDSLTVTGKAGETVSIVPVFEDVEGITISGFEYPLVEDTLLFGHGRGVSNVLTQDTGTIHIKSGVALVIRNRGKLS